MCKRKSVKTILSLWIFLLVVLLAFNATYANEVERAAMSEPDIPLGETEPQTNSWRGLVPLRSTREEVEKLLGKSKMSHGFTYVYENENELVDVLYSAGSCELSGVERWNIPKDVVIWMEVHPRKGVRIRDLHLDPNKYHRFQLGHPENWVEYWNKEEGVTVHTIIWNKSEEVYFFEYRPTAKDGDLRCKPEKPE
jgi:hypothetical protein